MSDKKSVSLEASTIKTSSDLDVSSLPSVNTAPVVQVTALSGGLYHIKWTFDITSIENARGRQEATFKLDQYSQTSYKLTLKYEKQDPEPDQCECGPDIQFTMNLKLRREACSTSQCLISKDGRDHSAAVWARIGRCQTIILDQSPYIFCWKSETFSVIPDWDVTKIPYQFWIKFHQSVGEINAQRQFSSLFHNQLNCDVTFSFDEIEEEEPIGGHAIILSARSSVFATMFQRGMLETSVRKVCIKDIKPYIFKQLLHYIYSGQTLTKLSEEIAQPLFVAANMYDIEDLKDECVHYLLTCIKLENAINLLAWAHVHSADSIKEAALDFAESHGKEICQQEDWERLINNYPNLCLLATRRMWK